MWCHSAASSVASASIPTPPVTAVEPEIEPAGVWTGWMNNMNPYEEGQRGDLEITKNMDPVSSDQYWAFFINGISMECQCFDMSELAIQSHFQRLFKIFTPLSIAWGNFVTVKLKSRNILGLREHALIEEWPFDIQVTQLTEIHCWTKYNLDWSETNLTDSLSWCFVLQWDARFYFITQHSGGLI